MVLHRQSQRPGKVFYWVAGLLLLVFTGILAYKWWETLVRQQEDAEAKKRLKSAALPAVQGMASKPGDWPQWRGPNRDGIAPGEGLLTEWPASGPPLQWKVPGGGGFAGMAVAEGRLYTVVQRG